MTSIVSSVAGILPKMKRNKIHVAGTVLRSKGQPRHVELQEGAAFENMEISPAVKAKGGKENGGHMPGRRGKRFSLHSENAPFHTESNSNMEKKEIGSDENKEVNVEDKLIRAVKPHKTVAGVEQRHGLVEKHVNYLPPGRDHKRTLPRIIQGQQGAKSITGHLTPGLKLVKKNRLKKGGIALHIPTPESCAGLDEIDLMDVDLAPSMKIRSLMTKVPSGVVDIDALEKDPYYCPTYAQEIYDYIQAVERRFSFSDNYLNRSPEVTSRMREILMDWLVQVQVHQEICQQTLHLTAAMIDRFLAIQTISLNRLQLLGITSLLISAKVVERFPPEIATLCHLTDNTYDCKQVLTMEKIVLKTLNFDLNIIDPIVFLGRFMQVERDEQRDSLHPVYNHQIECMAKYILDLSLTGLNFVYYVPSLMAASAVFVARKVLGVEKAWTPALSYYTKYCRKELSECSKELAQMLLGAKTSKYQGARNKYASQSAYCNVSNHPALDKPEILQALVSEETLIM